MSSLPSALNFYPSFNITYVPGLLFDTIVKIPFLLSDIAITLLLYKIVDELTKNRKLAETAAILWFLNPFVIWISAVWGMWDTLPALFSLVAFYFLLKKKFPLSAVFLSLGVALKLYPALFLVPIGFYILKTSPTEYKWKNSLKFFSVFTATTVLLFLPYIVKMSGYLNSIFIPTSAVSSATTNPLSNPVAFGLTYWSAYQLNRFINLTITNTFVSAISIASVMLVAVALALVYWKTSRMTFQDSAYDLALVLLLPVLALFLSYRIIEEQYFIWAIPFIVILCIRGHVKPIYYWGASIAALLYAVLNCPLPFFFLPLAPWYTGTLLSMVHVFLACESVRITLLVLLGCTFSALIDCYSAKAKAIIFQKNKEINPLLCWQKITYLLIFMAAPLLAVQFYGFVSYLWFTQRNVANA